MGPDVLVVLLLSLLAFCHHANAQECDVFRFGHSYSDHMVLQRDVEATVWGYAQNVFSGDLITLMFDGTVQTMRSYYGAENLPMWDFKLEPRPAGGPYTLTAIDVYADCTQNLTDVWFGDVYLCAGQNNMEHALKDVDDPDGALDDVINYPYVRTFQLGSSYSDTPMFDLEDESGQSTVRRPWEAPTRENMEDFSAVCWFFGRELNIELGVPIGLIQSTGMDTRIEAWSSPESNNQCFGDEGPPDSIEGDQASQRWNSMINPFYRMVVFGVIWYQGENNIVRDDDYICSMPALVDDWRVRWFLSTGASNDPNLPFGQVQLAPNEAVNNDGDWPDLRWSQTTNIGYTPNANLTNVFTAVAVDLPDFESHLGSMQPRYKRQVGYRLSLGALSLAYGQQGRYQGPFPTALSIHNDEVMVTYDNDAADLDLRSSDGFELCCAPDESTLCTDMSTWTPVTITMQMGSAIHLNIPCEASEFITGLRYVWRESPCPLEQCAVYSVDNSLPAPPYKYDGLISE